MDTSLVLHVDEEIVEMAKKNVNQSGKNLEKILENYIRFIAGDRNPVQDLPPITKKLRGIIHLPDGYDWKDDLAGILTEKHMK